MKLTEAKTKAFELAERFGLTDYTDEGVLDDVLDCIYDKYNEMHGTPEFDTWEKENADAIAIYGVATEDGFEDDEDGPTEAQMAQEDQDYQEHLDAEQDRYDETMERIKQEDQDYQEHLDVVEEVEHSPDPEPIPEDVEVSPELEEEMTEIEDKVERIEKEVEEVKVEVDEIEADMENIEPEEEPEPEQLPLFEEEEKPDFTNMTTDELKSLIAKKKTKPRIVKQITRKRKIKRDLDEFGFVKGSTQSFYMELVKAGKYTEKEILVKVQEKSTRGIHAKNALERKIEARGYTITEEARSGILSVINR